MSKKIISVLLAAVSILLAVSCAPSGNVAPAEEKVVKFGYLAPLTGAICDPIGLRGFSDGVRYINEQGGIDGVKIELIWADEQCNPRMAFTHYSRMKEAGVLVTQSYQTTPALAIRDVSEKDKIPHVTHGVSMGLFVPPRWIYGAYYVSAQAMITLVDWYYQEWLKKGLDRPMRLAILGGDLAYGREALEPLMRWVEKQAGIEIVATYWVPATALEYTTQLTGIKGTEPDAIASSVSTSSGGAIARDMGRLGFPKDVVLLQESGGVITGEAYELAGDEIGRVFSINTWWCWTEDNEYTRLYRELQQRYHGEVDEHLSYIGCQSLVAISAEAVRLAMAEVGYENLSGAAIKEYGLDRMHNFDGGGGALTSYTDYPGDRVGSEDFRILTYSSEKKGWGPITDWIKAAISIMEIE